MKTDGTEPSAASPAYSKPLNHVPQLRAAIMIQRQTVARADPHTSASSTSDQAVHTTKASAQWKQSHPRNRFRPRHSGSDFTSRVCEGRLGRLNQSDLL